MYEVVYLIKPNLATIESVLLHLQPSRVMFRRMFMSDRVKESVAIVEVSQLRPMLQHFNEEIGCYINDDQRYRLGKVLTLIDASVSDLEQRKAIKDIINDFWWKISPQSRISDVGMASPHSDIRGLTQALGFDLYPVTNDSEPMPIGNDYSESYAASIYAKIVSE